MSITYVYTIRCLLAYPVSCFVNKRPRTPIIKPIIPNAIPRTMNANVPCHSGAPLAETGGDIVLFVVCFVLLWHGLAHVLTLYTSSSLALDQGSRAMGKMMKSRGSYYLSLSLSLRPPRETSILWYVIE
jgi:hypothetical protein